MAVLVLGTLATWGMVGLIWLIQLVHYPLLALYSEAVPTTAAAAHSRRITPVVGPLMATEGVTALWLMADPPDGVSWVVTWAAGALLGVALGATVLFAVPEHRRLGLGHDAAAAQRLIRRNWIRTFAWTARGILLAAALLAVTN